VVKVCYFFSKLGVTFANIDTRFFSQGSIKLDGEEKTLKASPTPDEDQDTKEAPSADLS
jgi:hypothetical protein